MSGAFKCFLGRKEECIILYTDDYEIYCGVVKKDYTEEQAKEIMQKEIDKLNFEEDRKDDEKYEILSCEKDVLFYPVGHKENTEEIIRVYIDKVKELEVNIAQEIKLLNLKTRTLGA